MSRNRAANGSAWIVAVVVVSIVAGKSVFGHGDVQPQSVDTTGLPPLGDEWLIENPYRGNELAIKIGGIGYNQNCARCHGIDAISGGISPDLRLLDPGVDGDEWYIELTRNGYFQNDVEKMPKFEGILSQEAMWAIRSWLDTKQK